MPPKKKPYSQLSKSGKYYRDNKAARDKKKKTDTKVNSRPEQVQKRIEAAKGRAKAKKRGVDVKNKDYDHGSKRMISSSKNRGKKTGTKGDRNARGGKKEKVMLLNQATKICDEDDFVHSHLSMIEGSSSDKVKQPYRDRLELFKKLKSQENG